MFTTQYNAIFKSIIFRIEITIPYLRTCQGVRKITYIENLLPPACITPNLQMERQRYSSFDHDISDKSMVFHTGPHESQHIRVP